MRSVEEQLALVTAAAVAPRPVRVAISEAQGLLCAEEVVAERPLPSFDQAAIDGYAVRSVDVRPDGPGDRGGDAPDGPVALPVVGQISAGSRQPIRLQPGQTVRVDTGAPLPTLADAVLRGVVQQAGGDDVVLEAFVEVVLVELEGQRNQTDQVLPEDRHAVAVGLKRGTELWHGRGPKVRTVVDQTPLDLGVFRREVPSDLEAFLIVGPGAGVRSFGVQPTKRRWPIICRISPYGRSWA